MNPQIVIVTYRHPDAGNTYDVWVNGHKLNWWEEERSCVRIVDVDMGASFDGYPHADNEDWQEWKDDLRSSVAGLPEGHPAKAHVEQVIEVLARDGGVSP